MQSLHSHVRRPRYARLKGQLQAVCRYVAMLRMRQTIRNLARTAKWYIRRHAAAVTIQAGCRGMLARALHRRMWAAHQLQLAQEAAAEAAALAVIASWLPTMRAWTRLRRMRWISRHFEPARGIALSLCSVACHHGRSK